MVYAAVGGKLGEKGDTDRGAGRQDWSHTLLLPWGDRFSTLCSSYLRMALPIRSMVLSSLIRYHMT